MRPTRLIAAIALTGLAAACARPPQTMEAPRANSLPDAFAEAEHRYPPIGLGMAQCRWLTFRTEVMDFTAPLDAPPRFESVELFAEAPVGQDEMARGMMFRTSLPDDAAMIFTFDGEHNPVLWMKDTPSSLDMVFFDETGMAVYLEHGTEPYSERFLTPEDPEPVAKYVVELKAGQADVINIVPGMTELRQGPLIPCGQSTMS